MAHKSMATLLMRQAQATALMEQAQAPVARVPAQELAWEVGQALVKGMANTTHKAMWMGLGVAQTICKAMRKSLGAVQMAWVA